TARWPSSLSRPLSSRRKRPHGFGGFVELGERDARHALLPAVPVQIAVLERVHLVCELSEAAVRESVPDPDHVLRPGAPCFRDHYALARAADVAARRA